MALSRVEKILKMARYTLADPNKQRWDDDTLLAILNEAVVDFTQQTQMLHERIDVPIVIGLPYFTLPQDCWLLTRALYEGQLLPLVTHKELDTLGSGSISNDFGLRISSNWEEAKGIPEAIVYDRRNMLEGKVYPIPDEPLEDTDYLVIGSTIISFQPMPITELYGVAVATSEADLDVVDTFGVTSSLASLVDHPTLTPDYGVASGLSFDDDITVSSADFGVGVALTDYAFNSDFGAIVNLTDFDVITETFESDFGFIESITESSSHLKLYYLKTPTEVTELQSELDTPQMYDIALKFYLCGQAFMNDIDTAYQQKGAIQMQQYERHVKNASKDSSRDFTRAGQFKTTYRSGF